MLAGKAWTSIACSGQALKGLDNMATLVYSIPFGNAERAPIYCLFRGGLP